MESFNVCFQQPEHLLLEKLVNFVGLNRFSCFEPRDQFLHLEALLLQLHPGDSLEEA